MRAYCLGTGALCALVCAGAAQADAFQVRGLVEFGGQGGDADPVVVDGTLDQPDLSQWLGDPTKTGIAISGSSSTLTAGIPSEVPSADGFMESDYAGAYYIAGGVWSGTSPDGLDGVFLMNLVGDFNEVSITTAEILIAEDTSGNGLIDWGESDEVRFHGLNEVGFEMNTFDGDIQQIYRLRTYEGVAGNTELWIVNAIPAPGTAALLGAAGLAAVRRRR